MTWRHGGGTLVVASDGSLLLLIPLLLLPFLFFLLLLLHLLPCLFLLCSLCEVEEKMRTLTDSVTNKDEKMLVQMFSWCMELTLLLLLQTWLGEAACSVDVESQEKRC